MIFLKITTGCVVQEFNDIGECIGQKFMIPDGGTVEYETEDNLPINVDNMPLAGREYHSFDMVQPNYQQIRINDLNRLTQQLIV